ncbi:MAG TPA: hypothetical protein ENN36_08180 [Candidatus Bathyarchaeota archaeon]|nr:hypothetical protein [Candidatus Bathyarchaeota archaeon]
MSLWTKLCSALIIVAVLALCFAQLYGGCIEESSDADEVLVFLEEVVSLDVAAYDVTQLGTSVKYPDWLDGLAQLTGKFTLESETSKIDVLFKFRNGTLSWCLMRILEGSPQYTESQSTDLRDLATIFLQRYQVYSGDSELEAMRSLLDVVDVTENSTKTVGNLKLTVSITSFSSSFDWRYTLDGAEYGRVDISFRDGHFYAFGDDRSYYKPSTP